MGRVCYRRHATNESGRPRELLWERPPVGSKHEPYLRQPMFLVSSVMDPSRQELVETILIHVHESFKGTFSS